MKIELKPCPLMVCATHMASGMCIGSECAWWVPSAGKCAVAVIGEDACNRRAGEKEAEHG